MPGRTIGHGNRFTSARTSANDAPMPVRILLVDDHKILRDGLRLRLQQEPDFTVVGDAASAQEAYAAAAKLHPDLVIIDVDLPDDTGIVAIPTSGSSCSPA
jgi:DNA-binding NarL/FixJ family response regulator